MILPVTLTMAAAAAVLNLWLAMRIVPGRMCGKIMLGDGGDQAMFARQRAHANYTEYAPFVVLLIGAIELAGGSPTWLWVAGATFVLSRVAHGLGMTRPAPNPLRAGGAMLTWVILALLAGWALAIAYGAAAHPATDTIQLMPARAAQR